MAIENEWALVFSGGGVKGSYEIGVWQSLIESGMDKKITGVSGTSVGALNGALFALGDYSKACEIWLSITQEDIMSIDFKQGLKYLSENDTDFLKLLSRENGERKRDVFLKLIKEIQDIEIKRVFDIIKKGTIKRIVEEHINSEELRSRGIKLFATSTALLSNKLDTDKTVILEGLKYIFNNFNDLSDADLQNHCINALKEKSYPVYFDVNEASFQVSDILLASAAFPIALERIEINNTIYIDGGVHDNTPIKPLYDLGYRNFICVYLDTEEQEPISEEFKACNIIKIRPTNENFDKLKSIVLVDKTIIKEQMVAGFIDGKNALRESGLWLK